MLTPADRGAVPGQYRRGHRQPGDLALLAAIEAFILARGLHPDNDEQAVDWGEVFPGIEPFTL